MCFSLRHPLIKYVATGVAAILLIIITVTPLMTAIVESWSRRDVELRSRLVFRSIEKRHQRGGLLRAYPLFRAPR
jgi:hypothetical protein